MNAMTLISAPQLAARITAGQAVLVVDCRADLANPASAHARYLQGHIPGALFADLEHDLSDLRKPGLGRHPLPDAADFNALLQRWGWTPQHLVVAYDDVGGGLAAARLWWMMRTSGHDRAMVLDGGIGAWQAAGLPLEAGEPAPASPGVADGWAWQPDASLDAAQLQAGLEDGIVLLLDARAAPRFLGQVEPLDPVAGHVPGAVNRPADANLTDDGTFKPAALLREEFTLLLGGRQPHQVVHMCGSGVTACQNLLAMEHAGLHGSRLFAPSWSGWISDARRPVAGAG